MPRPPKFEPARRNPRVGPIWLPAQGREGTPPAWPLPGGQSPDEVEMWAQLWRTPQAHAWEGMGPGIIREVARYARLAVRAEAIDSYAALHAQATALADRLGLTPKAMRLMLWQIAPDEVAEKRVEKTQQAPEDELALRRRLIAGKTDDEGETEAASSS